MNSISPINSNNKSFKAAPNKVANFITKMTKSDAMAPVIALEATVVAGRTYHAYKRGKWDEARERFIEETMGSITWLGGVLSLNMLGDKILDKILKLNGRGFDVGTDKVLRTPFENFIKSLKSKKYTQGQIAAMKFGKVMTSVLLANLFIGFIVPPLNQALTRKLKHDRREKQLHKAENTQTVKDLSQNTPFKGGMRAINAFTNIIENTNTGKLLSGDVGTTGGRMYNARRKEERREVAIRDIGSIYFYMWAIGHVGNLMNLIESGKAARLNPTTTNILDKYLNDYMDNVGKDLSVEEFRNAVLGKPVSEIKLPEGLKFEAQKQSVIAKWMNKKPLEVAKVSDVELLEKDNEILNRVREMAKLQSERCGEAVITKQQLVDAYNKSEINNPKLLANVFAEYTGGKGKEIGKNAKGKPILSQTEFVGGAFNDEYRFVSNKKLYKLKAEMEQYVESICKLAKGGKVDKKLIEQAKNKNIMYNGINFAVGFGVAALFLSTLIPKFQYYVTRKTTGLNVFPGTYDYIHHHETDG
ncbi:hypothetical protein IJ750_04855 [bacterium]|nr:hypothetical protein [bacterium]